VKVLKTRLLTTIAAGALLLVAGGLSQTARAFAQSIAPQSNIAGVACAAEPGNWTDCTVTLAQPIAAGGSVAASLASTDARVAFCTDGSHDPDYQGCGINGNAAVFFCPSGCGVGQQFMLSALGSSNAGLSQSLTVAASGVYTQAPNSSGLALVSPGARLPSE
jgi:hypothetical protein